MLVFEASATLYLRNSALSLEGYYNKSDWAFMANTEDFEFDDIRAINEDHFGESLHESS